MEMFGRVEAFQFEYLDNAGASHGMRSTHEPPHTGSSESD